MFLTANSLVVQYGIDEEIAKFYVDREPPKDNLYWKDKLLYLRPQPGYIFLPLITDLYFRSGVSKEELLNEEFVGVLEQIGHYSAEQEFGFISKEEAFKKCVELTEKMKNDNAFFISVKQYFHENQGFISELTTPFLALHRGDLFLFSLCILNINTIQQKELIKTWFALISTLLLLDDAEDFENDCKSKDENAFIESGSNKEGFERIKQLLASNLDHLATVNRTLADVLHRKFTSVAQKTFIKEFLNA